MAMEQNSDLNLVKAWSLGAVGGSDAARKVRSVVLDPTIRGLPQDIVEKFSKRVSLVTNQAPEVRRDVNGQILKVSFPRGEKTIAQFGEIKSDQYFLYGLIRRLPEHSPPYQWPFLSGFFSTAMSIGSVGGRFELRSGSAELGNLLESVGVKAEPRSRVLYDRLKIIGWLIDPSEIPDVIRQCQWTEAQIYQAFIGECGRSRYHINGVAKPSERLPTTPSTRKFIPIYHLDRFVHIPGKPPPTVTPLPTLESPTPRRRRTIVCQNLSIDGEQWDTEEARLKMKDALKGDKADLRCQRRPGIQLASDYAIDVCLSSWCRNCPFLSSK